VAKVRGANEKVRNIGNRFYGGSGILRSVLVKRRGRERIFFIEDFGQQWTEADAPS